VEVRTGEETSGSDGMGRGAVGDNEKGPRTLVSGGPSTSQ